MGTDKFLTKNQTPTAKCLKFRHIRVGVGIYVICFRYICESFLQAYPSAIAYAVNFIVNIVFHSASEPVNDHSETLCFVKTVLLYHGLLLKRDALQIRFCRMKPQYNRRPSKILLKNVTIYGFENIQYCAAVLFGKIDCRVKTHFKRVKISVFGNNAVCLFCYNFLNERWNIVKMIIKRISVNAAFFNNVFDCNLREAGVRSIIL